jgi:hypothetical protein
LVSAAAARSMALEILHGSLVFLGRRATREGPEIAPLAGLWITAPPPTASLSD